MNVDEFLVWAETQIGRYELVDGAVRAMTPEGAVHAEINGAVYIALVTGIRSRGLACHALPGGMTVRVDDGTAHEPDALVYCGPKLPPSALEVPNPIIVVEVLSPSSRQDDTSRKLAAYFRLPSLAHYLVVDPDQPLVIHHQRGRDGTIEVRRFRNGVVQLNPPGLELDLTEVYGAASA
jgi:Uma2 family endonuclease